MTQVMSEVALLSDPGRTDAVRAALARLPEQARRIVVMRHRDRRRFDDIAAVVGLEIDDVRRIWFCSLEALAEILRLDP